MFASPGERHCRRGRCGAVLGPLESRPQPQPLSLQVEDVELLCLQAVLQLSAPNAVVDVTSEER